MLEAAEPAPQRSLATGAPVQEASLQQIVQVDDSWWLGGVHHSRPSRRAQMIDRRALM